MAEVLELVAYCDIYKVLPRSGGLLEQDAFQMYMISRYQEVTYEKQQLEMNKAKRG